MTRNIPVAKIQAFKEQLRGQLVCRGDNGYDTARRVWNGRIDRRPALIAFCADDADIVGSVRFAREHEVLAAVRGGGHNVAGTAVCDDGLVIDLSLMKAIEVEATHRTGARPGRCALGRARSGDPSLRPSGSRRHGFGSRYCRTHVGRRKWLADRSLWGDLRQSSGGQHGYGGRPVGFGERCGQS